MSAIPPVPFLFQRFPVLERRVPFSRLGCPGTPTEELKVLGRFMGRHLWVKRDDRYGSPGGGKVRKLEFALAALLQQERRCLITFGPLGSNHVAATAVHAAGLGIETLGVLVPQPLQFYVRGNLETSCHFARVIFTRWTPGAAFIAMRHWLRRRMSTGEGPALLAPGGSSIVGILGYVEAGLEIAQDVSAGRLPEPDYAFIPAGTCGALAGLAVGLRIAGLKTRAVGVRVASRLTCTATTTAWLANRVLGLLRSRGAQLEIGRVRGHDLTMLHSFCGRGYGHATEAGREALRLAYDTEGLALDTTYTGKAMAGMLAFMAEPEHRHARALFINTWAAPALIEGPSAIPEHIERWLARRESKGGSESPR